MQKLALLSLLLCACYGPLPSWGTVTEVDKDNRILFSSLWHYTVEMDDGRIYSKRSKVIIKEGWRVCIDTNGRVVQILKR